MRTPGLKLTAVKIQHKNCLQSTLQKKKINMLFAGLFAICRPSVLSTGPRPTTSGRTQDLWHSFSHYGPPGRQITYILEIVFKRKIRIKFGLNKLFSPTLHYR